MNEIEGAGFYDVKGSVPGLFWKLHHREEREGKGREYKFQKKHTEPKTS